MAWKIGIVIAIVGSGLLYFSCFNISRDLDARLLDAVSEGNRSEVDTLIRSGADPGRQGSWSLYLAVGSKRPELLELLLKNGANPNADHDLGGSILGFAAAQGDLGAVRILLNAGSDVNERDALGRLPEERASGGSANQIASTIRDSRNH